MSWEEQQHNEQRPIPNSEQQAQSQPLFQSPPQPAFQQPQPPFQPPQPAFQQQQQPGEWSAPFGTPDQTAAFDGPPTTQQPYLQDGSVPPPYGTFGTPPQPPAAPKKKRGAVVGAAVAAVLVIAAVGGYLAFGKSSTSTPIQNTAATAGAGTTTAAGAGAATTAPADGATTDAATDPATDAPTGSAADGMALPASADGLVIVNGSLANTIKSATQSSLSSSGIMTNALIGVYGKNSSTPLLVLLDEPLASMSPDLRTAFTAMSPALFVQTMTSSQDLTNATTETSSDPDAAISCGTSASTSGSGSTESCVWVDKASFGVVTFLAAESNSTAGKYADALRAAAEAG